MKKVNNGLQFRLIIKNETNIIRDDGDLSDYIVIDEEGRLITQFLVV